MDYDEERKIAYKIFAKLFYYPDKEYAKLLLSGAIIEFFGLLQEKVSPEAIIKWLKNFRNKNELLEVLQVEYTGLFITSFPTLKAPLYKSFYNGKELFGKDAQLISEIYLENNFQINRNLAELPDHLAVELEFVFRLIEEGEDLKTQLNFVKEHILSWTPELKERIEKESQIPFYPYLINVLHAYLTEDIKTNEIKITGVPQ